MTDLVRARALIAAMNGRAFEDAVQEHVALVDLGKIRGIDVVRVVELAFEDVKKATGATS